MSEQFTKTSRLVDVPRREKAPAQPCQPLNRLLYGKELTEYADILIEDLLDQLTEEELEQLSNEVDPDDPHLPPSMRCKEQTKKAPTGPLDRQKLLSFLKKYAMEQEDWPENKPFEAGTKRGKCHCLHHTLSLLSSSALFGGKSQQLLTTRDL